MVRGLWPHSEFIADTCHRNDEASARTQSSAGWHGAKALKVPSNISLMPLPPRALVK
jgi:hypothetical protein